jgi:hypothetical protein
MYCNAIGWIFWGLLLLLLLCLLELETRARCSLADVTKNSYRNSAYSIRSTTVLQAMLLVLFLVQRTVFKIKLCDHPLISKNKLLFLRSNDVILTKTDDH